MTRAKKTSIALAALGFVILLIAYGVRSTSPKAESELVDKKLLQSISRPGNSSVQVRHLSDELLPPTNRWFSSIVFSEQPQPVFPLPYSAKISSSGIEYGVPTPTATSKTIAAPHIAALRLTIDGADDYRLSYYDSLVIRVDVLRDDTKLGQYTLAQGVPFVWYEAAVEQSVTFGTFENASFELRGKTMMYEHDGRTYLVASDEPIAPSTRLKSGQTISMYGRDTESAARAYSERALHVVTKGKASYDISDGATQTTLTYETTDKTETIYAAMPHQRFKAGQSVQASYASLYGEQPVYRGSTFSFDTARVEPTLNLQLDALTAPQKATVVSQLRRDIASTTINAPDSYFGGKELYRAAQLYDIAMQLEQDELAKTIYEKMKPQFARFFDSNGTSKFFYDTELHGIVSASPAFGSENFNDHHFHYGYFLGASALVARHDKNFLAQYEPMVNLLAADIASSTTTETFPATRVYDAYAGHSWASGDGAFADGNNQESSSEAVHAWTSLGAWADATDNAALFDRARWLLSNESATATAYWLGFDKSTPTYNGYDHSIVSINWGAKRDYATFFSAEPTAILGIQLIPMNPTQYRLLHGTDRAKQNLSEAATPGDYNIQFGDYLLLYGAGESSQTEQQVLDLSPETIDEANSKTYMLALLHAEK